MVAEHGANNQLTERVAEIYNRLDLQIRESGDLAGTCEVCGQCCDFARFDHHLFVTTPELMYLAAKLGAENIKPMTSSRCPYNTDGKCTIYEHRFAGCRIFCCRGNKDFQSSLSESALKKFKSVCTDFKIPYHYTDLPNALNNAAANTYQPAVAGHPAGHTD
jgi:Fe-S-cluster containining protein